MRSRIGELFVAIVLLHAGGLRCVLAADGTHRARSERSTSGPIQHVVFIIQENRSFNNLFVGFKGATTQNYGYDSSGRKIKLHATSLATRWDIDHSWTAYRTAYDDGKLDGWNQEAACCGQPRDFAYAYVPRSESKTYWEMAQQYVLADAFFPSNVDGTFISHQYAIAAFANDEVNYPTGPWGCEGGPSDVIGRIGGGMVPVCEDYTTLGDELDEASLSWRYYTPSYAQDGGIFDPYSAINHIYYGPDYAADVVNPPSQFIADVTHGKLATVSWISPTFGDSDHAGYDASGGPAWVASLVNAVGQSTYWNSTAIFIMWDEWGGWFDPVEPVHLDDDGSGFRVPLIAISAYAKTGYVSHVQYETSSVLRFIEDDFGLAQMAPSDTRAKDPSSDFFDFKRPPRPFKSFRADPPAAREVPWNGVRPQVGGD
jgi:phospholipase C